MDAETLRAVLLDHVTTGEFDISYVRRQARSAARIPTLGGLDLAGSVHRSR
ncbi:MAG: hypothetical protein HC882_01975 [Acidobacteria bacterium]|nr:hypothetical protein [Acidobacteriota bacterium]